MSDLVITDHGNLFGAIDFYLEAQRAGIKPIIGCEAYISPGSRFEKSASGIDEAAYHFILLAKDEEGYKNLIQLVSSGYLEGFYYRPRIDKEILSQHAKGLIGLTACLKGEVPCLILGKRANDAIKCADDFSQIFGKDNFYLELQANKIPEQDIVNNGLLKISKELKLPVVATNDVHYLTQAQARAHEMLLCIQTQTTLGDQNRMRFQTDEFYFKSPSEMKELFKDSPEAITNTVEIASRCNLELDFTKTHLPRYTPPEGKTKEEFLMQLCSQGLEKRYPELSPQIKTRLDHELEIIKKLGFTSYFLIVWDFIHYAKENKIPVGPGRGSSAGSLVSYLLGITDIDPLKYGLIFERFLNPERVSLPDIDIDFCYERRPEVINYVTQKYGKENVAQIITFGTMQARAVIRDVGRVMGLSYADVDRIAKMIGSDPFITLEDALKQEKDFKDLYEKDPTAKQLIDTALALEGLTRHASIHAAGVVIADQPLANYLPLFKTGDDQITTGYPMNALEKIGLLKMDFLGLRTLTVIDETIKIIKARHGLEIETSKIPLDDAKTFKLLAKAQTMGVFQLESTGMRDLLKKISPTRFEDLIAILALYRPGPMGSGMLDDFIQRRHGRVPIRYDHKRLEPILKETYGIMVYQEQVMRIASELAGFSLAQADLLRRAMSKKTPEIMEQQRKHFTQGCAKNAIHIDTANKIFDLIEFFSGYGFNRSHSAAYALISYRTAYLKANFPIEFMNALLTSEKDNTDKVVEYVAEAGRMGLVILPADINASFAKFSIENEKSIRFGLLAVKNVGLTAVESIQKARQAGGPFKSLQDFCERVDSRVVNHKVIESLIKCGAMDSFGLYRSQLMTMLDNSLNTASRLQRERTLGQLSFFDSQNNEVSFKNNCPKIPDIKEWPETQVLAFEKEMLGFYVTGHPLARYESQIRKFASNSTQNLLQLSDNQEVTLAGLIIKVKHTFTRSKNEKMAILKLEDLQGVVEVIVFPRVFNQVYRNIHPNAVVLVKGRINLREESPKILANDILGIDDVYKLISRIDIDLSGVRENLLQSLKEKISLHSGNVPVFLHLNTPSRQKIQIQVGEELFVRPTEKFLQEVEGLLGEEKFSFSLTP